MNRVRIFGPVINRVGHFADFGLVLNRVRVLGSGPHTPTPQDTVLPIINYTLFFRHLSRKEKKYRFSLLFIIMKSTSVSH